jgi:hypothetical protein
MTLLNAEQREQFIRDGYVVARGLLPQDAVASTRDNLLAAMRRR